MSDTSPTPENDRGKRWQRIAIEQLGYSVNLFLALATAAIGYGFNLLTDPHSSPGSSAAAVTMGIALGALALSISSGLLCALNRLADIRGTARRARQDPGAPERSELRRRGRNTYRLFRVQIAAFAIGIAALGSALLLMHGSKLVGAIVFNTKFVTLAMATLGSILTIAGAAVLYLHPPPDLGRQGNLAIPWEHRQMMIGAYEEDEADVNDVDYRARMNRWGFGLIMAGSVLQLASTIASGLV